MLLLATLLPLLLPPTQDDPPAAALESRWVQYLARRPFHPGALEQLLARATELGGREAVVAAFEHLRALDAADPAPVVVLARLAAEAGRTGEALAALAGLELEGGELPALRARLALAAGRLALAREAARQALTHSLASDERRALIELTATTHLLEGDKDAATGVWLDLAHERRDDVTLQLDVARAVARLEHGTYAHDQYRHVLTLAVDPEVRARASSELGELFAADDRVDDAARTWHEADTLLGRGHWLSDWVRARLIELHRRAGRLDDLVAAWRARVDAAPGELAGLEGLAGALVAAERLAEATGVLEDAARLYPGDVLLARARARLARRAGDPEREVTALQHACSLAPFDRALAFDLGDALARGGRLEPARARFTALIEERPEDASLRARVARALVEAGQPEAAREVLAQAVSDLPGELALHLDLVERFRAADDLDGADRALAAAVEAADWIPADLERLADVFRRQGDRAGAIELLVRACEGELDARRLLALARLQGELARRADAQATLRRLLDEVDDGPLRAQATHAWVSLIPTGEPRRRALRAEEAALVAGATSPAPFLIVAELRRRGGDHVGARAALYDLLRAAPDDFSARRALVADLEAAGDPAGALDQVRELQTRFPARARSFELDATRFLVALGRRVEATERLESLARAAGTNATALRDLASGFEQVGEHERALTWLERALTLEPGHVPTRRRAAGLAHELGFTDVALQHLERAYLAATPRERPGVAEELHGRLEDGPRRERFLTGLRRRPGTGPLDRGPDHLAAELCLLSGDGEGCLEALATTFGLDPRDPEGLSLRARAWAMTGDPSAAADDLLVLRELEGIDRDTVDLALIDSLIEARRRDEALAVARRSPDPRAAAERFARHGLRGRAADLLEEGLRRGAADVGAWRLVAEWRSMAGEVEGAARALLALLERAPGDSTAWRELAELRHALGDEPGALEAGRRFLQLAPEWPAAERWFRERGMQQAYFELRAEQALRPGTDLATIGVALEELLRRRAGATLALDAVDRLAAREAPDGVSNADWSHHLGRWRQACLERDVRLARARLKHVRGKLLAGEGDGPSWREYASLLPLSIKTWNQDWQLVGRGLGERGDDRFFLEAVARHAQEEGRHDVAAQAWGALLSWIERSGGDEELRRESWAAHRIEVRRQLPTELLRGLTDERLDRYAWPSYDHAGAALAMGKSPLDAREVGLRRAVALLLTGRDDAGRAALRALEPADPTRLASWVRVARAWAEAGAATEVERAYETLRRGERRLEADLELALYEGWRVPIVEYWPEAARFLERVGRAVEAYDLLRGAGRFDEARSLLLRRDLYREAAEAYRVRAWDGAEERGEADLAALLLRAEVLDLGRRHVEAVAAWLELAEANGADPGPLGRAVRAAEAGGLRERAISLLRQRLEARATFTGEAVPLAAMPVEDPPPADAGADRLALVEHLVGERRTDEVLEELLAFAPGALDRRQVDQLCQLVLNDRELEASLPVLAGLRVLAPDNVALLGQYTGVLIEAGRLDTAEAALDAFPSPERARGTIARRRRQIERARGD